jgi:hypothetical protein
MTRAGSALRQSPTPPALARGAERGACADLRRFKTGAELAQTGATLN